MGTLQTEFQRLNLVKPEKETKEFGSLDTMLIKQEFHENCSKSKIGINTCIKEKHPLFKESEKKKSSDVKILYTKKEIDMKQTESSKNQRTIFLKKLICHLIEKPMAKSEIINVMKDVSCGKGTNESAITNFVTVAKWSAPGLISNKGRMWKIDNHVQPDQFVSIYYQNITNYQKHFKKVPKEVSQTIKKSVPVKELQTNVQLTDILNFFKDNGININVSGAVGINVKVNVEFSIKR